MKNFVRNTMKSLSLVGLLSFATTSSALAETPFTDVLFDEAPYVKVEVNGTTYNLLGINGVKRAEIMEKCEATYAEKCPCMFAEKFKDTMAQIGQPVADTVSLRLYTLSSHSIQTVDAPLTAENQEELMIKREIRNEVCTQ